MEIFSPEELALTKKWRSTQVERSHVRYFIYSLHKIIQVINYNKNGMKKKGGQFSKLEKGKIILFYIF